MSNEDSTTEIEYRPIAGAPGYRVGSDGTIWTCRKRGCKPILTDVWRKMVPCPATNGYLLCKIATPNGPFSGYVHMLVMKMFCGPRPEGHDVAHNDGNKLNNNLNNLRWATRSDNLKDIARHRTLPRKSAVRA